MPSYLAPGVYVVETAGGARPITPVGTSTAAFFGVAPDPDAAVRRPTAIAKYKAFEGTFVGKGAANAASTLATAVQGFFANGVSYCYVINLGAEAAAVTTADMLLLDAIDGVSIVAAPGFTDVESYDAVIGDCERRGDRFAILDTAQDIEPLERLTRTGLDGDGLRPRQSKNGLAAVYTPWIVTIDAVTGERRPQPPSGHLAGLYARVDSQLGVFKAPANTWLRGALSLTRSISTTEQSLLNSVGVNCIRAVAGSFDVWGARTLADPASEWCYVPVRRLVTMIAQSIERGTRWVVFEPNDRTLWKSIRRDIGAFLHALWRDGALAGAEPEDAFFVKCDSETTTEADIDAGRVVALIGIAPVKPGEFIVLRIAQAVGDDQVEAG